MRARTQAERALRASEARFRHQATHDPLTGLPNRTLFTERLAAALNEPGRGARAGRGVLPGPGPLQGRQRHPGHQVGDLLLVTVAERLRKAMGEHLLARLGGDEFVILVERSAGTDDMVEVAETALAAVRAPALVDGHELQISASIGIVERQVAGPTPAT